MEVWKIIFLFNLVFFFVPCEFSGVSTAKRLIETICHSSVPINLKEACQLTTNGENNHLNIFHVKNQHDGSRVKQFQVPTKNDELFMMFSTCSMDKTLE